MLQVLANNCFNPLWAPTKRRNLWSQVRHLIKYRKRSQNKTKSLNRRVLVESINLIWVQNKASKISLDSKWEFSIKTTALEVTLLLVENHSTSEIPALRKYITIANTSLLAVEWRRKYQFCVWYTLKDFWQSQASWWTMPTGNDWLWYLYSWLPKFGTMILLKTFISHKSWVI